MGKVLGKQHPEYGYSCARLATLFGVLRQPLRADTEFKESFSANTQNLSSIFQFTNEKEKTDFIRNIFGEDENTYSFYLSSKLPSEQPYSISLFHRNLILYSSEALKRQVFSSNDTALANKYNDWVNLRKYLSVLYSRPVEERKDDAAATDEKAGQLEKELASLSPDFAKQRQKVGWKDIRANLRMDQAAIEFAFFHFYDGMRQTDSVYYVAIVLKKSALLPTMVYLCNEKQLKHLLSATGNSSTDDAVKSLYASRGLIGGGKIAANKSIYDLVWRPLEKELTGIGTVYFAPAGMLHRIAFAALPINKQEVLSDKYNLVQLASTASIPGLSPTFVTSADNLQLYGGIKYDTDSAELKQAIQSYASNTNKVQTRSIPHDLTRSGTFAFLPGTEAEVDSIETLAKTRQINIAALSRTNATEESFKALDGKASPSVIHIATHGFFFPDPKDKPANNFRSADDRNGILFRQSDNPLFRSGLIFAGGNLAWQGHPIEGIDDGILTAYEVSNMYLPNTKLVVLSACETALGDIQGSEGVYGLQRAFKIAGVPNLIMSLWKVPDKETVEFMQEFYKNLFAGESISTAFYRAQKVLKAKYRSDPYKWAAWVLVR
jgi:CHAT domain-containing protein